MHLDLADDETAALTQELNETVENDPYPFSPRIRTLRAILAKLRPEPVRRWRRGGCMRRRKPLPEDGVSRRTLRNAQDIVASAMALRSV
jgi:hypothetical protein